MSVKNTQHIIPNLCIFLTSILLTLAAPAEIYKWVDDEGKVHYGEKPPNITTDGNIETIKFRDNVDTQRASEALKKKSKSLNESTENRNKEKNDALAEKEKLAKNKTLCQKAKEHLAGYQHPKVSIQEEDGSMRSLGEEEKQLGIKKGKEMVEQACNY